jgi:transposase
LLQGKERERRPLLLAKNCTTKRERNKKVLADDLIPSMRFHGTTVFLQDDTPCHKRKVVMNYLKESQVQFSIMDWPGNSPDLNPIENCWSYMKKKLKGNPGITSLPKLMEAIKMMWVKDMKLDYVQKLSDFMPKRLQIGIDVKGEMTKY